ncbi:MAG: glycosyltransferase [Mangrovibacterium sp.]|nr:glycosyltransferase [Mangrovibacterium sp.]
MMMQSVKIIGPAYPYRGGLAAYNERLTREFIARGFRTDIETFTLQYPGMLFPGKTQYADWGAPEGLAIRRTVNAVNPSNWIRVGNRIRKEKPDLVIFKYWIPFMAPSFGTIIRRIQKNRHTKVVCIADNIIPHEKRPGDRLLTGYFMRAIDGIVAMSQRVYDDIPVFRKDIPRALCPHPLFDNFGEKMSRAEALQQLGLDPASRYLLFFGFIRDYKGLDILLKAMASPGLRQMPVKLIVAGEFYTNPRPYFELIGKLGIGNNIIMMDKFIADHEVNTYFCAADMVVQPYKDATQSGVTQIGYHFDKPMLVTNVGGLAEIIPDQRVGYVVCPEEDAVAAALTDFYRNGRQQEFEANVAAEKMRFSWSNMVSTIEEVFNQTVPS